MIGDLSVLALITARGGSKGVPRKNVRLAGGKPLIAWTIEAAKASRTIDRLILSSDDEEIMEAARQWGCQVPFCRPAELSGDTVPSDAVIQHAVKAVGESYDLLVLLQPTSPLRSAADIDACVERLLESGAPTCISVQEAPENPYWMVTLGDDGRIRSFVEQDNRAFRRQDLPTVYATNGAVYAAYCRDILAGGPIMDPASAAYIMPAERSLDVDTEYDFTLADLILTHLSR